MAETTPTTAKDILAKQKEERQKSQDEAVKRMEQSKPTPTQEENDLARLGEPVMEKEDDGSGPELVLTLQAKPAATTEAKPAPAAAKATTAKPSTSSSGSSSS